MMFRYFLSFLGEFSLMVMGVRINAGVAIFVVCNTICDIVIVMRVIVLKPLRAMRALVRDIVQGALGFADQSFR